ncbi:two-component sensor histidine kinase, partial [Paenibacillus validus]|nr:two-component sensor histidine kinase [Paenibacillus validus]
MTIRTKLLVFIPLLVLLVNSVTFFLFESGKIVQMSYGVMMDRILLYNQSAQTAEDNLRLLHAYLLNPGGSGGAELEQAQAKLQELRAGLARSTSSSLQASSLTSYVHMLDTLMEQE